jgi:hypothetical protein
MADRGVLVFRIGAVVNWVATVGAIVDPVGTATRFGAAPPNYPFLLRIWSAMAFMFGCMFSVASVRSSSTPGSRRRSRR